MDFYNTAMVGLASTQAIRVMWNILSDRGWAVVDHAMYLGADASHQPFGECSVSYPERVRGACSTVDDCLALVLVP